MIKRMSQLIKGQYHRCLSVVHTALGLTRNVQLPQRRKVKLISCWIKTTLTTVEWM